MGQRIGFIGQDASSVALADRLVEAGFEVTVFLLTASRSSARKKGITKIVSEADLIVTFLANPQEVEELYFASEGILESLKPGRCCIDLTSNTPQCARELHALASVHDCFFIEASLVEADGSARLFVGGELPIIEQMRPVLDALSTNVLVVGLPGTASSARISSVIAQASALMGLVETITFALINKIEVSSISEVIASDPHIAPSTKQMALLILQEQFDEGVPIEPFFNELSVALDAADDLDLALPILETAHQLYDLLMMVGGSKKALQALALVYREEEYCTDQGLDWDLAQRAMDVYEQANGYGYSDYDDDCDNPGCGRHHVHDDDDEYPRMDDYYSPN